jgi:MATE family multidrug resistance protein
MYDGLFLGLTEGGRLRNSMLFSTLVVFLPIAVVGLNGRSNHLLWAAMALFMAARTATLWLYLRHRLNDFAASWCSS